MHVFYKMLQALLHNRLVNRKSVAALIVHKLALYISAKIFIAYIAAQYPLGELTYRMRRKILIFCCKSELILECLTRS